MARGENVRILCANFFFYSDKVFLKPSSSEPLILGTVCKRINPSVAKVDSMTFCQQLRSISDCTERKSDRRSTLSDKKIFFLQNEVNPFLNKLWFLRVCSTSLLQTLRKKGEIARNEQFLLFPQCFISILENFLPFLSSLNCRLQTLSVQESLKFVVWERVKTTTIRLALWAEKSSLNVFNSSTLYQTTNFRLFQIESICGRQQTTTEIIKLEILFGMGTQHCRKRRKFWLQYFLNHSLLKQKSKVGIVWYIVYSFPIEKKFRLAQIERVCRRQF